MGVQVAVLAVVVGGAAAVGVTTSASVGAAPVAKAGGNGWAVVSGTLPAIKNGKALKTGAVAPKAFTLSAATLTGALAGAPSEKSRPAVNKQPVVSIPGADGTLHRFTFVDSPVMQSKLAAKVAFKSYAATAVDEPGVTARFDYSAALGFHATVSGPNGGWSVDPAYQDGTTFYVAYRGLLLKSAPEKAMTDEVSNAIKSVKAKTATPGDTVTQRTYRFALANNPEYADLVGAANVDALKAAIINRVNEVYGVELAVKFVLVNNNNLLDFNTQAAFSGANGPCGVDACYTPGPSDDFSACGPIIDQNVPVFDTIIGNENFDIGHILALGTTGGVAAGRVGVDSNKAKGCSGAGDGKSDLLAVEFFAHEIGHQFSANHSFSSASCGGFNNATAVETGSGSSIMSYAGTCAQNDNIQQYSDPYFAHASLVEMRNWIATPVDPADNGGQPAENAGFTTVVTSNHSPVVTAPATAVIPVRTPFVLKGTVADADSDIPGNVWEQNDAGTIRPLLDNDKTDGPLFRTFGQASMSPNYETQLDSTGNNEPIASGLSRTLPDIAQVAAGNTNAASGSCPTPADPDNPTQAVKECYAEFLPTSARTLHFWLTARDRALVGGGVTEAQTTVTVAGSTPFKETNTVGSVAAGSSYAVNWNVAGTTAAPFNVANVKISYSTDGGLTYPTVLSASTPNDGTQSITVPSAVTTKGRFKVEAIGQPFFDISHADLTVTTASTTAKTLTVSAGNNQTAAAAKAFATKLAVVVKDVNGNPKAGTAVTFTVSSGSATFPGPSNTATVTSGTNGVATATTLTAGSTAGTVVVKATATGTTTATFTETVTASADIAIKQTGPASAPANTSFSESLKVTNNGPSAATTARVAIEVPTGVTVTSATAGSTVVNSGGRIYRVWMTAPLPAGTAVTYSLTYKVGATTNISARIHTGATSKTPDPVSTNNMTSLKVQLGGAAKLN